MENNNYGSINISGSGSAGGGRYDSVKISGSGKITGDVVCNEFKSSGSAKVENTLEAEVVKVSGSAKFVGDVTANEFKSSGSANLEGNFKGGSLKVSGSVKVHGQVDCEEVSSSGSLKVEGDCNAEVFRSSGSCGIGGLLNANEIEIKIGGRCEIGTIGAENVDIKLGNGIGIISEFISSLFGNDLYLYCDSIEGDNIFLENTMAKVVRGNRVKIGKGCKIDRVEYKESVWVDRDARVESQEQL